MVEEDKCGKECVRRRGERARTRGREREEGSKREKGSGASQGRGKEKSSAWEERRRRGGKEGVWKGRVVE